MTSPIIIDIHNLNPPRPTRESRKSKRNTILLPADKGLRASRKVKIMTWAQGARTNSRAKKMFINIKCHRPSATIISRNPSRSTASIEVPSKTLRADNSATPSWKHAIIAGHTNADSHSLFPSRTTTSKMNRNLSSARWDRWRNPLSIMTTWSTPPIWLSPLPMQTRIVMKIVRIVRRDNMILE